MLTPDDARRALGAITDQAVRIAVDLVALPTDDLLVAVPEVVAYYSDGTAALAADHYDDLREVANPPRRYVAEPVVNLREEKMRRALIWAQEPLYVPEPVVDLAEERIAEVVSLETARPFRDTILTNQQRDPSAVGWRRHSGGGCGFCRMLASRGATYRSESSARFAAHGHCVIGSTVVASPTVERRFRRWYEGEAVVIRLASGDDLTITPKHPVLTSNGWVDAGRITQGDDVLARTGAESRALGIPYEHEVPTRIEDGWRPSGMFRLRSMPVAAEDFHGDAGAGDRYVDVVSTDRFLSDDFEPGGAQGCHHDLLAGTWHSGIAFAARRHSLDHLAGLARSADGVVRRPRQRRPLLAGHPGHSQDPGFDSGSSGQSGVHHPPRHGCSGDAVALRHGQDAFAGGVGIQKVSGRDDLVGRRPADKWTRYNPPPLEREPERLRVMAKLGRDLRERLAGSVEPRRVVDVRRIEYSGHVYNLQTVEGWYAANGIIVSNCKCSASPVFEGGDEGPEADVWQYLASSRTRRSPASQRKLREYLRANFPD